MEPRIHLVKITDQDFEDYCSLAGDEKVMAMITGRAMTREEARAKFNALLASGPLHESYGCFMVLDRSESELLGFAKLEIREGNRGEAELGYMLKPESWGLGYGGEIAAYLMKTAEADPELSRVYAIIDPANTASKKILIRQGFLSVQKVDIDGWPSEIFGRKLR